MRSSKKALTLTYDVHNDGVVMVMVMKIQLDTNMVTVMVRDVHDDGDKNGDGDCRDSGLTVSPTSTTMSALEKPVS